jgi:lipoprotein NlpD
MSPGIRSEPTRETLPEQDRNPLSVGSFAGVCGKSVTGETAPPIRVGILGILAALILSVAASSGCTSKGPAPVDSREGYGPAPAGYYRVRSGDTLSAIAFRRKLDLEKLAQWNRLAPPYRIYSGRLLRVEPPGAVPDRNAAGVATRTAGKADGKKSTQAVAKASPAPSRDTVDRRSGAGSGLSWGWPLKGKVVQTFRRGDRTRQGIRIAGTAGHLVKAAEGGTVVYSGSGLKGYGNLIIVKHNKNYLSAYGFNRRLLVSEGQRVERGQGVAEMGQLANGDSLLHFEIRKDGTAVDPLRYLPRSR